MIPWITVMALLFGASAITPDHPSGKKHGASKEASVSHAADDAQFSAHSSAPLPKLPSIAWCYTGLAAPSSSLLRVDHFRDRWVRPSTGGVSEGRAPPARLLA
jgi:hypothetical protein